MKDEANYIIKYKAPYVESAPFDLRILVIILYWDRPKMVRNALNSIKEMEYDNWELAFIDDGSEVPGEPIVREILGDHIDNVKFTRAETTMAQRFDPGSPIGLYINDAVMASTADVAVLVCDDDALLPNYFSNLNKWFSENPNEVWGYCHVVTFDPSREDYHTLPKIARPIGTDINSHTTRIAPSCAVDSSQVAYRTRCIKDEGIRWIYPQTGCLDANFYEKMYAQYGLCPFMGFVGQYKAYFQDQMGRRGLTKPADLVYSTP